MTDRRNAADVKAWNAEYQSQPFADPNAVANDKPLIQVYDTVTGRHLMIPQGTKIIGKYDSVVAFGQ